MSIGSALRGLIPWTLERKNTLLSEEFIARLREEFPGNSGSRFSGRGMNESAALSISTAYACVRVLSESVGTIPLKLFQRGEGTSREELFSGPLFDLMQRPNTYLTPTEWSQAIVSHLALRGNSLWEKIRVGARGEIARLRLVHPDNIRGYDFDQRGEIDYRLREPRQNERIVKQRDMFHVRLFSLGGVFGLNPIQAQADTLGVHDALTSATGNLFKNGAIVQGVLEAGETVSTEERKWLKEQWDKKYSGVGNAGGTPILESGVTYKPIGMTSQDAQFIEARKLQKQEVAMLYRVPLFLLNDTEKATTWGTGLEQLSSAFVRYTLSPYLTSIEQAFYQSFVLDEGLDPDIFPKFNANALMRGSYQERQFGNQIQAQNGVLTPNEWRAMEDRNPIEGGDEVQRAENLYGGEANADGGEDQNGDAPGTAPPE